VINQEKKSASQRFQERIARDEVREAQRTIKIDNGTNKPTEIHKSVIYFAFPILKRADDVARMDACMHIIFGDKLETPEGKAIIDELKYKKGQAPRDAEIDKIVSASVQILSELFFNEDVILRQLTRSEREMMAAGMDNLMAYKAIAAKIHDDDARSVRSINQAREMPPEYEMDKESVKAGINHWKSDPLTDELMAAYREAGIPDKNMQAFRKNLADAADGKPSKPAWVLKN